MRGKKTYLNLDREIKQRPEYLAYWEGEYGKPDDADLTPELAMIVQDARASYSFKKTPAQNIRETLQGLRGLDDNKVQQAAQNEDESTKASMCTAAAQIGSNEQPETQPNIPPDRRTR